MTASDRTIGEVGVLRQVTPHAAVLLAPNAGPLTLEGTNTWLLRDPDRDGLLVVDPGPDEQGHLEAIAGLAPVELIVLTHRHADHSAGAPRLAELTGADVLALDPAHARRTRTVDHVAADGERFSAAGVSLTVLHTPGHSSDSLCLHLEADDAVLTGDTILGRGTTVVFHPDGQLEPYVTSLRRLAELGEATLLPGHGPDLPSAGRVAQDYLAHRTERLEQVRQAVASGLRSPQEIVDALYTETPEALHPAARRSVQAQLVALGQDPGPDEPDLHPDHD